MAPVQLLWRLNQLNLINCKYRDFKYAPGGLVGFKNRIAWQLVVYVTSIFYVWKKNRQVDD